MKGDSPYKYNPTFGYGLNGERKTSAHNEYHKPQISLNHLWQVNEKTSLSTTLYTSIGRGSGYSGQGYTSTLSNSCTFRSPVHRCVTPKWVRSW